MSVQDDFADLTSETIAVYKPSDVGDFYHKSTYGPTPTASYGAFVSYGTHEVRDGSGNVVVAEASAIVLALEDAATGALTYPNISVQDKIVLPDGTMPAILSIDKRRDDNGPHHLTIHFL